MPETSRNIKPGNSAEKYLVTTPLFEPGPDFLSWQDPPMTLMSRRQVPEADYRIGLGWVKKLPRPATPVRQHVHDTDQIILLLGTDHRRPQVLGGEIELFIGGQLMTLNTSAGIFIPRGVTHGPASWKRFQSPHILLSIDIGNSSPGRYEKDPPEETDDLDYEQFIVRSPMREAGAEFTAGRTSPTMTFMSGVQVPGVRTYIELGWTFGMPRSKRAVGAMPEMAHKLYDEIVLHVGADPGDPGDLGADIVFYVDGQPLEFKQTSALFIPRGVAHGPIKCLEYRRPHLVMAMMCGAANIREGWADSFKPEAERP